MSYLIVYSVVILLVTLGLGIGIGYHLGQKQLKNFKKQKKILNKVIRTTESC